MKRLFYRQRPFGAAASTLPTDFFMPDRRRTVFFVSDGTGITVEMLGHSLLTQFDGIESNHETVPSSTRSRRPRPA